MLRLVSFVICMFYLLPARMDAQQGTLDSLRASLRTAATDTHRVNSLNLLSRSLCMEGKTDSGEVLAIQAEQLASALGYKRGLANAYSNHGNVFYFKGELALSLEKHMAALNLRVAIADKKGIGASYLNLGNIYKEQANTPKALEYYFQALRMREEIGDKPGVFACLNNIGSVYEKLKDYKKALEYYFRALEAGSMDLQFQSGVFNNIANIYYEQSEYDKAIEYYGKAKDLCERIGYRKGVGMALSNMGNTYDSKKEHEKALSCYMQAFSIGEEINDKLGMGPLLINLSNNCCARRQYRQAMFYGQRAVALSRELGITDDEVRATRVLSQVYEAMGAHEQALAHYKAYITIRDCVYNEESTRKHVRIEMNYEFEKKVAATRAEQEKKDAVAQAEARRQRIILLSISGFGLLVLAFAVFAYRSFLQKKKANIEIVLQKRVIEEKQQEILDSIHYAKRIQHSLIPTERVIARLLAKCRIPNQAEV